MQTLGLAGWGGGLGVKESVSLEINCRNFETADVTVTGSDLSHAAIGI